MKKRMKLTEKELTIGMWLYIKLCIKYYDDPIISQIKYDYLKDRQNQIVKKWSNYCILLYHKHNLLCSECPLTSCLWSILTSYGVNIKTNKIEHSYTLQERLEACDKIIEAIENDIPDDYKS